MRHNIRDILQAGTLRTVFQPIVEGTSWDAHGFEALTRGPASSALEAPASLFSAAVEQDCMLELEQACIVSALKSFSMLKMEGKLFLNVRPETLLRWDTAPLWLQNQLHACGIDPRALVLEITEHGVGQSEGELATAVAPLRSLGCEIAIDDLGTGVSGLQTWSAIRPEYVKVDRYFIAGIESDPVRGEILRAVIDMGRATSSNIIAEGIENREQCSMVAQLGVDLLQGYYIGRPALTPVIETKDFADGATAAYAGVECAEQLAHPIPPVDAATPICEVVTRFQKEPQVSALAVVEGYRPVGLIRRDALLILYSKPLHPEIYARKPVRRVMDSGAVRIDARARLEQVSRLLTGQEVHLQHDDFIITRGGSYLGLGRTMELLRQITTQQLQAARQSNPLTGLPGNREIDARIKQLMALEHFYVACHLDLDHFKAYNDTYGYSRGDQVLLHIAQTLRAHTRRRLDFVGHVGGDDFVFFLRSQDWRQRLADILLALSASLPNFHSEKHKRDLRYTVIGREGMLVDVPLLSASIGAVECASGRYSSTDEVLEQLRCSKAHAKSIPGNSCILSSQGRLLNLQTDREQPDLNLSDTAIIPEIFSVARAG